MEKIPVPSRDELLTAAKRLKLQRRNVHKMNETSEAHIMLNDWKKEHYTVK